MVSRTVENCQQIMRALVGDGFTHQISKWELEKYITVFRGGCNGTVKEGDGNFDYCLRCGYVIYKNEVKKR